MVQVQIKATQAHPHPVFAQIPPANPPGNRAETDKNAAAQAAQQVILNNSVNEKTEG